GPFAPAAGPPPRRPGARPPPPPPPPPPPTAQPPSDPPAGAAGPPPPEGETLKLANAFVCTANIAAADGGAAIVEGNRRVLAARLSDARFFWEQDRKTSLAEHATKLERITFHEKLGTVADKVERVAKLVRWLVEEGIVGPDVSPRAGGDLPPDGAPSPEVPAFAGTQEELAQLAYDAAKLCKADLVTEMVGEFPELQGVMGGYYARAEGLDPQIADAIRDHYKPVGQGNEVPTAPVTVAVSLADKLDTLVGFFGVRQPPTGSSDPFALRRAALAVIQLLSTNGIRLSLRPFHAHALRDHVTRWVFAEMKKQADADVEALGRAGTSAHLVTDPAYRAKFLARSDVKEFVDGFGQSDAPFLAFFADRLKVQQREAGVRHDLIDAVFALGGEDDLVRLLARVKALQHYIETAEGADLLAAYKRAANILRKENWETNSVRVERSRDTARGISTSLDANGEGAPTAPLNTQGIARTGEEDPLAMVDDPDMASVVAAQLAQNREKTLSYTPEDAETALIAALDSAEPTASAAIEAENFAAAMSALATLRAPIDRFFDEVTVNDPDPARRAARLGLLARFRDAVHRVADFSRIEG
ncbi:MAG: glycine--tRNA ligase subunit beta, partial [Qipengyuania sp.]|nr:glycine--tRNA ligase subunit beta [Qipengyuania sp.]